MPMRSYYDLLNLTPSATPKEIRAAFRRFVARYRATTTADRLWPEERFRAHVNAYLTLAGQGRAGYDEHLRASRGKDFPQPTPLELLAPRDQQLLMARIAFWRREMAEAMHTLRTLLERDGSYGAAWALQGEVFFAIDRAEDGVKSYERAVAASPRNATYAARLQQAREELARKGWVEVEPSAEEELLREERRKRLAVTLTAGIIGLALIAIPVLAIRPQFGFILVPWNVVGIQAGGALLALWALAYGRFLQPFERVMVFSSVMAGDRGRVRRYPYGMILFVTAAASLWLAVLTFVITALMDEEWPGSTTVMMALCALANVGLALFIYFFVSQQAPWVNTLVFGGNLLVIAALLGWWIGSFGAVTYD